MNISLRWLQEFLRRDLDAADVAARLAMLGAPVDAVEQLHAELAPFVVARVLDVGPHPDSKATKIRLATVDDGTGAPLTVVCGAPNVAAGGSYPFARLGTRMPGPQGFRVEPRPIRGVVSEGMLCSARELGLGQEHDGIMLLDTDAAPGTPLLDAVVLADTRLVVDVTPNRPDLLGHKGVARELSVSYGAPFRLPVIAGAGRVDVPAARLTGASDAVGSLRLAIEDAGSCPRFHAAVIQGAAVGPSPDWLRRRLEAVGVRSINNVVDATNYVMLELNQPMHAYAVSRLRGATLVVRRARAGERVPTLDEAERRLPGEMVAIADSEGVIGIAGVMGGASTEVSAASRDILLEAAYWDPARIRRTRRDLNLGTEASYRFERGIDLWGGEAAMRRCIEVVLATAGGTLVETPLDLWPVPTHPPRIFLRPARVTRVLGIELPWHE
ncbi:MAG: phenylalanine--tRNA ligase subunit beta, partial [Gemmatimonadota bacterium]|nr:phenylalanine--tRNA ligase subunit beta [Gemmatimonadota bacterium]